MSKSNKAVLTIAALITTFVETTKASDLNALANTWLMNNQNEVPTPFTVDGLTVELVADSTFQTFAERYYNICNDGGNAVNSIVINRSKALESMISQYRAFVVTDSTGAVTYRMGVTIKRLDKENKLEFIPFELTTTKLFFNHTDFNNLFLHLDNAVINKVFGRLVKPYTVQELLALHPTLQPFADSNQLAILNASTAAIKVTNAEQYESVKAFIGAIDSKTSNGLVANTAVFVAPLTGNIPAQAMNYSLFEAITLPQIANLDVSFRVSFAAKAA